MDGEAIDSSEKDRLILAHLFRSAHLCLRLHQGADHVVAKHLRRVHALVNMHRVSTPVSNLLRNERQDEYSGNKATCTNFVQYFNLI